MLASSHDRGRICSTSPSTGITLPFSATCWGLPRAILSPVSISQLHYFITVAEEQNVGRASRRLRVAQPAVSRQIKNLESELGCPLFSRTPRGMALSSAGRSFYLGRGRFCTDIAAATLAVRGANGSIVPAKVSDHRC